ncbi:ParM/StbA family protein (plasmid) [Achromobacter seleniivolatilans]|uniref:ParM/StbA family protein n=1 Tax=Achromobacter seleniivolatilans TaxID=3047478 RepID=A0ABY9MAI8_9BURK|nr:ParM/StbA family protein [Achromobacter sp. R39]WMD23954.1 ParM/StbA family protein [Achromobacter sp. R39]
MSKEKNLNAVGGDDGHHSIKIAVMQPGAPIKTFVMPARAWPGKLTSAGLTESSTAEGLDKIYMTSDNQYVTITADDLLGKFADTRSNDYPTSATNRALVHYALRQAGVTGPTSLVSGLPVDRFYLGEIPNKELIDAKRQNLLKPITCLADVPVPVIETHQVLSEAVAAFFDQRYDDQGKVNQDFHELSNSAPIAVVDGGGKTLDIAVVREGGTGLYKDMSGTADVGALTLYDRLNQELRKQFSLGQDIAIKYLEQAVKTGEYRLYGKPHDVSKLVEGMLEEFSDQVRFEVSKRLKDASQFGCTLFVGGVAELLGARFRGRVFPGLPEEAIFVPVDPGFANARGMAKAAFLAAQRARM